MFGLVEGSERVSSLQPEEADQKITLKSAPCVIPKTKFGQKKIDRTWSPINLLILM
jgi:hypothetical protein